jgi:broad specificity phosphatase PhoE
MRVPDLILIRHGEVDVAYKGVCYGAMDVPLSERGAAESQQLAQRIVTQVQPAAIYHSGLTRTQTLAHMIAQRLPNRINVIADNRLRERNYGDWQGTSWDEAYASDPEHFHDLIERPSTYRPPGGETTTEMQMRVVRWYEALTSVADYELQGLPSVAIAISHSGPIAALAGYLQDLHPRSWHPWMIGTLGALRIAETSDRGPEIGVFSLADDPINDHVRVDGTS